MAVISFGRVKRPTRPRLDPTRPNSSSRPHLTSSRPDFVSSLAIRCLGDRGWTWALNARRSVLSFFFHSQPPKLQFDLEQTANTEYAGTVTGPPPSQVNLKAPILQPSQHPCRFLPNFTLERSADRGASGTLICLYRLPPEFFVQSLSLHCQVHGG